MCILSSLVGAKTVALKAGSDRASLQDMKTQIQTVEAASEAISMKQACARGRGTHSQDSAWACSHASLCAEAHEG